MSRPLCKSPAMLSTLQAVYLAGGRGMRCFELGCRLNRNVHNSLCRLYRAGLVEKRVDEYSREVFWSITVTGRARLMVAEAVIHAS